MPIKFTQDDGNEVDVYTQEEIEEMTQEKDDKIKELESLNEERSKNFSNYNKLTKEQKDAFSENEQILLSEIEKLNQAIQKEQEEKTTMLTSQKESQKSILFKSFDNGDEETRKKLTESYEMLAGMPDNTPEEIHTRSIAAARLAGVYKEEDNSSVNPVYTPIYNAAPPPVTKDAKEFTETEKGSKALEEARKAMGINTNEDNK